MTGSQFSVLLRQVQALRESIDFLATAMDRVASIVEREGSLDLTVPPKKEDADVE